MFVSDHPVLKHKLTLLRSKETSAPIFRQLLRELTFYLGYEITSSLGTTSKDFETPVGSGVGHELKERVALIPVMRAGLGMVEPMLELVPPAKVHHIGMYREKKTLCCVLYYNRLPVVVDADVAIVLEPLIATGNTLDATLIILKQWGVKKIAVMSILATDSGLAALQASHPDVSIHVGGVDSELTARGVIMPGLGDVGDRLWGTWKEKPHGAAHITDETTNVTVAGGVLIDPPTPLIASAPPSEDEAEAPAKPSPKKKQRKRGRK